MRYLISMCVVMPCVTCHPACHAELILNGSFEQNSGNGSNPAHWSVITNSFGAWNGTTELPTGGSFVLHPGANFNSGGRYQDVSTIVNQKYEFSFWGTGFTSGNATQDGIVQVGTAGAIATSLTQNNNAEYVDSSWTVPINSSVNDWVQFTHTFTAMTTTTRVSFQNVGKGAGQNAINVDLVSLTAVPEPSTFAIFGLGLVGFGAVQYRRRKAASAE